MAITRPIKLTRENSLPVKIEDRAPVYAKSFNEVVDIIEEIADAIDDINDGTFTVGAVTLTDSLTSVKAEIKKPTSASVASGGTITAAQLLGGLITATGATGNWQLPTAAQITTAIGSTPAGTNFEFIFNASGMTSTNTATLVVGSNITVMSSPAITGGGTLTVTQASQGIGIFRILYITPTTCKITRIS